MKIAVIGGSGRVGKRIVRFALERGHEVWTFNRRGERAKAMNPGVEKAVSGNYTDLAALTEFVRGADVVVGATIHVRTNPEWYVPGNKNIMAACRAAGVKRVLFVENHCTLTYKGEVMKTLFAQPLEFSKFIPLHMEAFEAERANAEDLDWTVVTAPAKMLPYGRRTGQYLESTSDEILLPDPAMGLASSEMSMEDFADFFVGEIEKGRYVRQRVAICNPLAEAPAPKQPLTIAVIGACGRIGSRAIKEAEARGHTVVGIDPRAEEKKTGLVSLYPCAIEDTERMTQLLTGCDAVFNAIAPNTLHPELYGESIRLIMDECKAAGVKKLLSIIGSSSALLPDGRKLLETDYFEEANRSFYENICKSEEIYEQEKELNWGCITPAAFMELDEPVLRRYRMGDDYLIIMQDADQESEAYFDTSKISLSDFAFACVDELENDKIHHRRCCVGY